MLSPTDVPPLVQSRARLPGFMIGNHYVSDLPTAKELTNGMITTGLDGHLSAHRSIGEFLTDLTLRQCNGLCVNGGIWLNRRWSSYQG